MDLLFPVWPNNFEELFSLSNSNKDVYTSLCELLCCLFVTSCLEYRWFGCKLNSDARTAEVHADVHLAVPGEAQ